MERQKSLFNKKIKCHCGGNYKFTKQREYNCYICSRYANYRECQRLVIHENLLLEFITRYCQDRKTEFIKSNEFIDSILNFIRVREDEGVEFIYNDNYIQIYSDNLIRY